MSVSNEIDRLFPVSHRSAQQGKTGIKSTSRSVDFEKQIHDFERSLATHDTTHETPHTLFSPMHYEPGYAYPLIIWLHGKSSAAERQLMKIMPIVSMRNYVAVAPRGAELFSVSPVTDASTQRMSQSLAEAKNVTVQYGWPDLDAGFDLAQNRVFDCLQIASEKCNISKRRVFLAGFDDGGTMAFRVALRFPQYFAGVVSLCGAFPQGKTSLGRLDAIRNMPCLMSVGRDSPVFPPTEAAKQMTLFHTAGMAVTVRQYPCRQELSTHMLEDVNRWIMERVTQRTVTS